VRLDTIVPDGEDGFTGMFLRRSADGEGPLEASQVKAIWDLTGNEGVAKDLRGISMRPFGVRMVYVPEGPFHLGSGGLEPGGFYRYSDGSQHIEPYLVTDPGTIPTGRQSGRLWTRKYGGRLEEGGEIPASFPSGFGAFYCMKHQIAPAQYAAFLNALPEKQADERYAGKERWAVEKRDGKVGRGRVHYSGGQGHVVRTDDGYSSKSSAARAGPGCFGLSWADGAAFAAWAGLRPITELELEKAVRGRRKPMPDEVGPSYWGIGGINRWDWEAFKNDPQSERTVTAGNAAGRRFRGTHGLGTLSLPADWPQADAVGSGMRCTHYTPRVETFDHVWDLQRARLSDRMLANVADPERCPSHKWRGVRTAPQGVGP
jgi:formylglycine-generating enzyme required for sulfatase activity